MIISKVKLTPAEEEELSNKMYQRFLEKPRDTDLTIFNWVMNNDWPQHRRRKLASMSLLPVTYNRYLGLVRASISQIKSYQATMQNEEVSISDIAEMLKRLVVIKEVLPDLQTFLNAQSLEVLYAAIGRRMEHQHDQLLGKMSEKTGVYEPRPAKAATVPLPVAVPLPKKDKLRVIIIGPVKRQFEEIKDNCANTQHKIELYWMDKDSNHVNVPSSCDFILIAHRFMDHRTVQSITNQIDGHRIRWCWNQAGVADTVQLVYDVASAQ